MPTLLVEGKSYIKNQKDKTDNTKERDDTMAVAKPVAKPGALVLQSSKANDFFQRKTNTSSDALKRFEERKPKDGIVTPFKR